MYQKVKYHPKKLFPIVSGINFTIHVTKTSHIMYHIPVFFTLRTYQKFENLISYSQIKLGGHSHIPNSHQSHTT